MARSWCVPAEVSGTNKLIIQSAEFTGVFHECLPCRRKLAVKAEDIFGNDTMKIAEVSIGAMNQTAATIITKIVLVHYPAVQGVYLFGSYGTENELPGSDADVALLLPHEQAKREKNLALSQCRFDLEETMHKPVDLLNLRRASTVMQKEIIGGGTLIYCADRYAVEEFEMLVLSFYQKLNDERAEVLAEGLRSGRFYNV